MKTSDYVAQAAWLLHFLRLLLTGALLTSPTAGHALTARGPVPTLPAGTSSDRTADDLDFAVTPDAVFLLRDGQLRRLNLDLTSVQAVTKEHDLVGLPVVAGGTVYELDEVGAVLAFNAATLQRQWRTLLAGTPQRLSTAGSVLLTQRGGVVTALNVHSGRIAWQVRGVDTDHSATNARAVGGVVIVEHVPAESIQGEVFTAHDPATGKQLWQQAVGHGYLLAEVGSRLTFDVRDWQNLLDDRGGFRLEEIDARTGRRHVFSRSLRALPRISGRWEVAAGTPTLEPDGTLWMVVQAGHAGGVRLLQLTPEADLHLWPLPSNPTHLLDISSYHLVLTGATVVVAAPDGQVTTLNRQSGHTVSVALPNATAPLTLTALGHRMGVSGERLGVVVFSVAGRIEFRVTGGALPALAGQSILVLRGRDLVHFPLH